MASDSKKKDLIADAKNFCDGMSNVFMLKKRDPQTRHLLEKAKHLIESLIADNQKLSSSSNVGVPRQQRSGGGMGQLWVQLDELKRENQNLRRQFGKAQDDRSTTQKGQGPGEVIIAEHHRFKQENDMLRSQCEKQQTTIKEMESINAKLQEEYKSARIALETTQKSMETILKDYRSMESNLKSVKTENESLKSRLSKQTRPLMRNDSLSKNIENISEKCRPTNIAFMYNTLESQEWMDAKEAMEDESDFEEENITQFLCAVLMEAFQTSKELHSALKSAIAELIRKPTLAICPTIFGQETRKLKLPDDISDGVSQQLRQFCDDLDVGVLVNMLSEKLKNNYSEYVEQGVLENKAVGRYLHESARITWQMAIQQPPMCLSIKDTRFDDDKHKLWWSCDQSRAARIDFFIWPALYDYENGNLLIKGCVHAS
ncbi:hypothetical protein KUTeg_023966 [Tegillarca granosa]|uniref:Mitochondria-eating protein n=1 Tax=Tegillarca granosa TaxID=220873 RepID=A0ABQ9E1P1_TEGGR|nr:hypothetical protein KUTeg_023966 [Tegillarca granosa]